MGAIADIQRIRKSSQDIAYCGVEFNEKGDPRRIEIRSTRPVSACLSAARRASADKLKISAFVGIGPQYFDGMRKLVAQVSK